jgi:hypothetical protein
MNNINEIIMEEQKLIENIRSIFMELLEEEKERFDTTTRRIIYPRNYFYVNKSQELYRKAVELERVNNRYETWQLKHVIEKEVDLVNRYEYEYKENLPKAKSVTKMQNLMRNATKHIQLYFYDVLGDIEVG